MRKQISLIGKRLAAGLLGAAMLFTAVGVAAPVEARAATHNFTMTFNKTSATTDTVWDVSANDIVNVSFQTTDVKPDVVSVLGKNVEITGSGFSETNRIGRLGVYPASGMKSFMSDQVNNGSQAKITVGNISELTTLSVGFIYYEDPSDPNNVRFKSITGNIVLRPKSGGTGTTTGSTTSGTGTSTDTKPATEKTEPSIPVHTHNYNWETLHEPTEEHDGEMVDICSVCGDIRQRVPITGFYLFQKETMDKVRAAAPNATVEVKTSKWISFHRMVMNALAERQDVTLKVSFLENGYKGARKTLTIPAGTDTNALLNEEGYAGFKYLGGLYGLE